MSPERSKLAGSPADASDMFAPLPVRRSLDPLRDVEIALDRAAWDALMPLREPPPPPPSAGWERLVSQGVRALALALVLLAALAALATLAGRAMS